jgi:hypothetical protein
MLSPACASSFAAGSRAAWARDEVEIILDRKIRIRASLICCESIGARPCTRHARRRLLNH